MHSTVASGWGKSPKQKQRQDHCELVPCAMVGCCGRHRLNGRRLEPTDGGPECKEGKEVGLSCGK